MPDPTRLLENYPTIELLAELGERGWTMEWTRDPATTDPFRGYVQLASPTVNLEPKPARTAVEKLDRDRKMGR